MPLVSPLPATLTLSAPAKINLFLNVRGLRDDGYHTVGTVLQSLSLADRLTFQPWPEGGGDAALHLTCDSPVLQADIDRQPERNLITRAYHLFWQHTARAPLPLAIHLKKRIPMAAGLGGGSADAATTLHALNLLCGQPHDLASLQAMARTLGADVPFLLSGGTAWADDRGDRLQPIAASAPPQRLLLVKPHAVAMPTVQAYARLRARAAYQTRDEQPLLAALSKGEPVFPWVQNDFEAVVVEAESALADVALKLRALGLIRPLLCGSGAAMAGFFPPDGDRADRILFAAEAEAVFPSDIYWHALCTTMPRMHLPIIGVS